MDSHLWGQQHDIGRARRDERLVRGLAAYDALRSREDADSESAPAAESRSRTSILHRLLRRNGPTSRMPVPPVV